MSELESRFIDEWRERFSYCPLTKFQIQRSTVYLTFETDEMNFGHLEFISEFFDSRDINFEYESVDWAYSSYTFGTDKFVHITVGHIDIEGNQNGD